MTNLKIQKLLYYSQSLHLALQEEPLFSDEVQAWRYGPVCPPAYRFYSRFEAEQLPVPSRTDLTEQLSSEQRDLLEEVWLYFGEHHAYTLSDMTHVEFPWKKARQGLSSQAPSTVAIPLEDLKRFGEQKLEEIERYHPAYKPIIKKLLDQALVPSSKTPQYVRSGEVRDWLTSLLN